MFYFIVRITPRITPVTGKQPSRTYNVSYNCKNNPYDREATYIYDRYYENIENNPYNREATCESAYSKASRLE